MSRFGTNSGHGHVWARPDGVKARCGGPALCAECAGDLAEQKPGELVAAPIDVKFPTTKVVAIVRGSPAWDVIVGAIGHGGIKPGQLIPVTQEQFESLRTDCLVLDVLPAEPGK